MAPSISGLACLNKPKIGGHLGGVGGQALKANGSQNIHRRDEAQASAGRGWHWAIQGRPSIGAHRRWCPCSKPGSKLWKLEWVYSAPPSQTKLWR